MPKSDSGLRWGNPRQTSHACSKCDCHGKALDERRRDGLAPPMEGCIRVLMEGNAPQAYGIGGSGILEAMR